MKKLHRIFSVILVLTLMLTGCQSTPEPDISIQQTFDEFIEKDFVDTLQDNYLNMHIYTENPENFHVNKDEVKVTLGSVGISEEDKKEFLDFVEEFKTFDREELTPSQQDIYDTMAFMIEIEQELIKDDYKYFSQYFAEMSGIQRDIPELFANLVIRNEEDVQDIILLLQDVRPYVSDVLEYTKEQADAGYLMADLDSAIQECETIVKRGTNNSVRKAINKQIEALNLSKEKTKEYEAQVEEAMKQSYIPAFEDIVKVLKTLKDKPNNRQGLVKLEKGKEYYELLFKRKVGTERSIEDVKSLLNEYANDALGSLQLEVIKNPNNYEQIWDVSTNYKDYESMLKDLNQYIQNDFPEMENLQYEIQDLDAELARDSIAAYFVVPALDSTTPKKMFVNTQSKSHRIDSLQTFTTVAHEGIPGHMYCTSQIYNNLKYDWMKVNDTTGFTEGYATYIESIALGYLSDKIDNGILKCYEYHNTFTNCIVALIDIGIHYEGWSLEDTKNFLSSRGLSADIAKDIYEQVQDNPVAFDSYYVGCFEIMELRKEAEKALGDKFNAKAFHQALIEGGGLPFSVIKRHIDQYIEANQ